MPQRQMSEVIRRAPVVMPPEASVQEACAAMHRQRIGAVVVVGPERDPLGIFTGRDAARMLAEGRDPASTRLRDAMTPDPACMHPPRTAIDALRLMHDGGFRHLPLVEGGCVVGVVSHGDFRAVQHARLDEETGIWERI
ncbi:MAG TPA: CBS domain-containing protein [Acetobacteraceae bacterium]